MLTIASRRLSATLSRSGILLPMPVRAPTAGRTSLRCAMGLLLFLLLRRCTLQVQDHPARLCARDTDHHRLLCFLLLRREDRVAMVCFTRDDHCLTGSTGAFAAGEQR